jgi:acyl-CoA reductase-like NAD-dependent aldehyde dehydrogenase
MNKQYKVNCVSPSEAIQAVESAQKAFKSWKKHSAFGKRAIFLKALHLLEQRKEEYVKMVTEETTGNQFWG